MCTDLDSVKITALVSRVQERLGRQDGRGSEHMIKGLGPVSRTLV